MTLPSFNNAFSLLTVLFLVLLCALVTPAFAKDPSASVSADDAFFSGCSLLSKGQVTEAISPLEKAVQADPENARYRQVLAVAYNNLGLKLTREGNVRDGVLFLGKALNVVPEDTDIRSNFVQTVLQAVSVPEEKIRVEEKVAFLKEVMEIESKNTAAQKAMAVLLNNCGVAKGRTGDHEGEVAQLQQAYSLDPGNTTIKRNLANAYYNLALDRSKASTFQDAANLLRKSLKLSPKDQPVIEALASTLSNLAVVKGGEGDISGQISLLKESLDLFPGDALTRTNLAAAYNNYAMTEIPEMTPARRIANLEVSLKLDPTNRISKSNYCNVLVQEAVTEAKTGSFTKAIRILEKAAKVDPENKSVQTNLAAAYQNEAFKKGEEEGKHRERTPNSSKKLSTCHLLGEYLERLVYICFKSTDTALDSKLVGLKTRYGSVIEQVESAGLSKALVKYEEVCRCVNGSLNSGTALRDIYSRNLCGSLPTKQLRKNILNKCGGRLVAGSHQ